MALKHIDPNRPPGWFSRAYAALANTGLGRFLSRHVVWKLYPYVLRRPAAGSGWVS